MTTDNTEKPRHNGRRFLDLKPKPPKVKKDVTFTKRQVDLIALRAAGLTLQEAGEKVGYPATSASSQASAQIASAKKKLSKNERLQEMCSLRGASLERVAQVLSDAMLAEQPVVVRDSVYEEGEDGKMHKVNRARIEFVPDHRARLIASNQTTEIFGALPDKKIVTETRTFETKLSVIAEIRQNPAESIAMIQALLVEKMSQNLADNQEGE
jgi:hypothetical protein